ncbi:YeeE/YedE family protein [Bdellovibrio sp.]|uniref:YeeE/YedE family protein n=1 Tax=Bdellovibrio sp. TaxID=28201 RepID=UPI0039E286D7
MQQDWINALWGGSLIGISVSLMLLLNGRVTGISGIISGMLSHKKGDTSWRLSFVAGLLGGGLAFRILNPPNPHNGWSTEIWPLIVGGLLVGFGTLLGSGCTSGHGVCGISRLSPRSMIATLVFILTGVFAVFIFKKLGVLN